MALCAVAAITMAPASTMPWMEFASDISGVCSVAGTLLMTSKPTQRLSTKMMKSVSSMNASSRGCDDRLGQSWVHHLGIVRDDDSGHQLILEVHREGAVGRHVQQQGADVARVHGRGRRGHGGRQVVGPDDGDPVVRDGGFAGHRALDVTAERARAHVHE